jgi:AcrR family transcriptional regulator
MRPPRKPRTRGGPRTPGTSGTPGCGGQGRSRTPSADIEGRILDAAERLLQDEGAEALSVRRISREARVAPMGVYNHFDGKNGVVDALFRRGFAALALDLTATMAVQDPREALRAGGLRYRDLALEHPATYRVMFLAAVPDFEPSEASKAEAERAFGGLIATVERAMQAGIVTDGDATASASVLWAGIHGAVALELSGICFVDDPGALYAQLVDTLLDGLAPRPS